MAKILKEKLNNNIKSMKHIFKKIIELQKRFHLARVIFDINYIQEDKQKYFLLDVEKNRKAMETIIRDIQLLEKGSKTKNRNKIAKLQVKALNIKEALEIKDNSEKQLRNGAKIKGELEVQLKMIKKWKF